LFFTFTVLLATMTSKRWREADDRRDFAADAGIAASAITVTALAFAQLLLGAQLRHQSDAIPPATFQVFVVLHLVVAGILTASILWLALRTRSSEGVLRSWVARPAGILVGLVALQLALGAGAWVTNYGWPSWFDGYVWAADFVVRAKSQWQANITTAHVAVGSLMLGTAAMVALRAMRVLRPRHLSAAHTFVRGGAAA
jgi:cytochrome c oxidase assembly protein subunit 15